MNEFDCRYCEDKGCRVCSTDLNSLDSESD